MKNYNLNVSELFLRYAGRQLKIDFEKKTGIRINKNVGTAKPWSLNELDFEKDACSFNYKIYINHNWNPVKIKWRSKSGRIYLLSDEDIDYDDIVFWFEDLDPVLYHQQLYPKEELPFKLRKLNFDVKIENLSIDLSLEIYFDRSSDKERMSIVSDLEKLINDWNEKTEREDAEKEKRGEEWNDSRGVVHNWKVVEDTENRLILGFDMGSADIILVKKMIQLLDKKHRSLITRVIIC